ncbi:MAG: hypothetical protein GY867_03015 [bacterium]|nr:hypothetical protein [bacterium]
MSLARRTTLGLLLLVILALSARGAGPTEHYIRFTVDSPKELNQLTSVISIARVQGTTIHAFANDSELDAFEALGYDYTLLPHPSTQISPRMAATASTAAEAWDAYPTYSAYTAMMSQFELDYPGLCQIVSAGTTVEGREILFAVISDNVGTEEDEPEVMHTSTMHGNETVGYVLLLRMIDSLLVAYGSDAAITRLVDSTEIWINPLANPDGTYRTGNSSVSGATRANANGVDLNRNFPDPAVGNHPDGNLWQPETVAMMSLAEEHSFTLSANHHAGAEVVCYPWDTWFRRHADDSWYQNICHLYADTVQSYSFGIYMTDFDDGVSNGYDWYRVTGGRQDYMIYERRGREITVELSNTHLLPEEQLPGHWVFNRVSLLQFLENGLYGIRGLVTDASTGLPVFATVTVLGHDLDNSEVWTDPDVGDYHRMIEAGTYDLRFTAEGYFPDTVYAVTAVDRQSTVVDVALTPLPNAPVLLLDDHGIQAVQAGDTVSSHISLENIGLLQANGVSGELVTTDSYITITEGTSAFPLVPALGGLNLSVSAYEFTVSPTCPFNHTAEFQLVVTADGGYLDTILFSIPIGLWVEDFETADFTEFPWQLSGAVNWTAQSTSVFEGSYAAKSGAVTHSQYSELSVTVDVAAPGELSFFYKVSSEADYDFLKFSIDGQQQYAWSGEVPWTKAVFSIDAGSHTFAWRYEKDAGATSGDDRALVDLIVFPSLVSDVAIYSTSLPDWTVGQPYSEQLTTAGGTAPFTWSDLHCDLTATGLTLSSAGLLSGVPLATGPIEFTAAVTDNASGSDERLLALQINELPVITTVAIPDAERDVAVELQLLSSGGTAPFTWSDRDNDLAGTGLALSPEGILSGTPPSIGTIDFTAHLEDLAGAATGRLFSFEVFVDCCAGLQGNVDCDVSDIVDVTDIQVLVDNLFLSLTPLCCFNEADLDTNGLIDITDLSLLIDNQFLTLTPLSECP